MIRFKNVRGKEMDDAVDLLLEETRQDEKAQSRNGDGDRAASFSTVFSRKLMSPARP